MKRKDLTLVFVLCWLFLGIGSWDPVAAETSDSPDEQTAARGTGAETSAVTKKGISIRFEARPVESGAGAGPVQEGTDALVRFMIEDSSGSPIPGLYPAAWIDTRKSRTLRDVPGGSEPVSCRDKINAFLQGGLAFRPELDLNTYYLLTLNEKASISIIDPHVDFSITKMVALVRLDSPGEDWVASRDGQRIFVTMPRTDGLAVVDTTTWQVERTVAVSSRPMRVALQPDQRYVWIGNDGGEDGAGFSGVSVIDPVDGTVAAQIATGAGHHELAFSGDSRYAVVTNAGDGNVTVIDVRRLKKLRDVSTGPSPAGVAFSAESRVFYVTDRGDGSIVVVDPAAEAPVARIAADRGLGTVTFAPGGRWAFVVNGVENKVYILDAAVNGIRHTVPGILEPDMVAFTPTFAYIRSVGSQDVSMIGLSELGKGDELPVLTFPGGQTPPAASPHRALAPVIVPTPEENTVVVANPGDRTLYYYMEGMVAPMGSFQSFGRTPKAVMVIDRSLQATAPGEYATTVKLPRAGTYDVAFLLDAPFMYHCFTLVIEENPDLRKTAAGGVAVTSSLAGESLVIGGSNTVRITLSDTDSGNPKVGVPDLRVFYFRAPGTWQKRVWAREVGAGVYEAELPVPIAGVYYVYVEAKSEGIRYDSAKHLVLLAKDAALSEGASDPGAGDSGAENDGRDEKGK